MLEMTKSLATLIKLQEHALNEMRQALAAQENQHRLLESALSRLEAEIIQEEELVSNEGDMLLRQSFSGYKASADAQKARIETSIANAVKQMDTIQENMRVAFAELKTYETLLIRQQEEEQQHHMKTQQGILDEMGNQAYMRLQSSGE